MHGRAAATPTMEAPRLEVVSDPEGQAPPEVQDEYARSLSYLRRLGAPLVHASVELEAEALQEIVYDNYVSALREMLKTDGEFRGRLDIDDKREHRVVDGQVRDKEGVPMVDVVRRGREISEASALWQRDLSSQVVRDRGDEVVAERVDQLQPGESLFALSMEPKDELQNHRKTYRGLGYRDGLSFIQWYARTDEGTVVAGSFSVDLSDETAWREQFAAMGVEVPEGESPNTWIQHTLVKEMDAEQAEQYARDVRQEYYERRGVNQPRQSVSEYVAANEELINAYFEAYYPALAEAIYGGQNNQTLQELAGAILETDVSNLKGEVRQQLLQVGNGKGFTDELGRTMDSIIRYAVVEDLRSGLSSFVSGDRPAAVEGAKVTGSIEAGAEGLAEDAVVGPQAQGRMRGGGLGGASPAMLHRRMASRVEAGVKAGRSYGGCSSVELSKEEERRREEAEADPDNPEASSRDPQGAYGDRFNPERRRGKRTKINCLKCRWPTTIGEVEQKNTGTWRCPHCKYEIDVCTGAVKNECQLPDSQPRLTKSGSEKPAARSPLAEVAPKREAEAEPEASPEPAEAADPAPVASLEAARQQKAAAAGRLSLQAA